MNVKVLVGPNQKRLRYLDEEKTTNITGIGKRNDTIINGEITYDIEYNKTKNREIIIFFNDFEFSGNETFPPNETIKANLMNISTEQRIISWRHCCYCSCYFLCGCCCYSCSFIVENWLKSTYEG
jgi:hypothetical protein